MPTSNHRSDSYARSAAILLALIALTGSVLLVVTRPASATDCTPPMVVDPADGAFAGDPITIAGPSGWNALTSVEVFLDGISLGTAATGLSDSWSLSTNVPALSPGTYTLEYVATPFVGASYSCDLMQYTVKGIVFTINPGITFFTTTSFGLGTITFSPGVTVAPSGSTSSTAPATSSSTTTTTTTAPTTTTLPPTTTAPTTTAPTTTAAPSTTTEPATSTTGTEQEATTTSADTSGTSLVAGAVDRSDGGGGTLIGVLIGLAVAAALAAAWLLGRRTTAPSHGYGSAAPPPPPPPDDSTAFPGE